MVYFYIFSSLNLRHIYVSLYFHTHTLIMKFHFSSSKWTAHIISLIHIWMNDNIKLSNRMSCCSLRFLYHAAELINVTCPFQFGAVYVSWIVEYQFAFKIYMHHPQTVNLSCVFFSFNGIRYITQLCHTMYRFIH